MQLHNLKPAGGSVGKRKRIARGQGSGHGGTATRGHKGDKSRSGHKNKRNFEGGQMPIQMRLPKRGFKNPNRKVYVPLNLERLQAISEKYKVDTLDPATLAELGIVRKNDLVKILGTGELNAKLTVTAHAYSETAKAAIEAQGGTLNLV
ncbi:MAG: 50S ribosomal protein L15 [Lewinella sp.]|nr:50S ribosomal protein L15 [Lewinella sp.]